jgi:hypothetical protein
MSVPSPIVIDPWDRQEMWDNNIEASVYQILLIQNPLPATAGEIADQLTAFGRLTTKDEVGDALYDGALRNYVQRTGEAPNRLWHLRFSGRAPLKRAGFR